MPEGGQVDVPAARQRGRERLVADEQDGVARRPSLRQRIERGALGRIPRKCSSSTRSRATDVRDRRVTPIRRTPARSTRQASRTLRTPAGEAMARPGRIASPGWRWYSTADSRAASAAPDRRASAQAAGREELDLEPRREGFVAEAVRQRRRVEVGDGGQSDLARLRHPVLPAGPFEPRIVAPPAGKGKPDPANCGLRIADRGFTAKAQRKPKKNSTRMNTDPKPDGHGSNRWFESEPSLVYWLRLGVNIRIDP